MLPTACLDGCAEGVSMTKKLGPKVFAISTTYHQRPTSSHSHLSTATVPTSNTPTTLKFFTTHDTFVAKSNKSSNPLNASDYPGQMGPLAPSSAGNILSTSARHVFLQAGPPIISHKPKQRKTGNATTSLRLLSFLNSVSWFSICTPPDPHKTTSRLFSTIFS
jgi:hypothetical protein